MNYCDQKCLGLFLLEICDLREAILKKRNSTKSASTQRRIPTFFTRKDRDPKEQPEQNMTHKELSKGVRMERATDLCKTKTPKIWGISRYKRSLYQRIKVIMDRHKDRPTKLLNMLDIETLRKRQMLNFLR